ncbi:MAG TPA: AraC family transcriptional regulator [Steroidobacteraceae bacterium]|nr:AraC family transcriptional regulator [Steroidobacteraceae bacterium]
MDALSDVLKSVRLEGAVFLDAEFAAPWCLAGRFGLARARRRLPAAGHVVFFHFLLEGHCRVRLADDTQVIEVAAGDVVLFPRDDRHLMGSDLRLTPIDTEAAAARDDPEFNRIRMGGTGARTRFVCSYLACSRGISRLLFEPLPRLLRIPVGDSAAAVPIRELLRLGVQETAAERPGGASMLARLAELLFVEALRRHVASQPPQGQGWLAAAGDAQVGRALTLLHREPARAWNVASLARAVALSRSALAERFTALVGEPPMRYLTRWRLALAATELRGTPHSIKAIARGAGYESSAAFHRAFAREYAMTPAAWRRG